MYSKQIKDYKNRRKTEQNFPIILSVESCPLPGVLSNCSRSQNTFNFGDIIKFTCNHGYQLAGEYTIASLASGLADIMVPFCLNTTEGREASQCSQNALCMDKYGSFGCSCLPGFTGNGLVCSVE